VIRPPAEPVQSGYLGGKLILLQPEKGYRAAIDPALLAASLALEAGDLAVEFGCGVGAALFSAAVLNPKARFIGIEQDPVAADLARRNAQHNQLSDRTQIITGDALTWRGDSPADAVFFNPPFFDDATALRRPAPEREAAWINAASLADWIAAGLKRLREGGRLTVIQRADRLGDILAALTPKAGGARILPIHPHAGAPAKRVIVSATKTSKAPLQILPGLVLHTADGGYTPEADAVLRGAADAALTGLN
jgi:tRNA1(Val) A37 N6-methylase TrmN6